MNLQILKWLVAHRDLLTKIAEAAKGFSKDLPYAAQWEIVDKVARLIIPVLTSADVHAMSDIDWEADGESAAFALGAEYQALGIDWATLLNIILPILQIILDALASKE